MSDYACESLIRLWLCACVCVGWGGEGVGGVGWGGNAEIATRRAQALLIKAALRPPRNAIRSSVIDSDERKRRKQPPRTFKAPRKCGKKRVERSGGRDRQRCLFQRVALPGGEDARGKRCRPATFHVLPHRREVFGKLPLKNGHAFLHLWKNVGEYSVHVTRYCSPTNPQRCQKQFKCHS